MHAFFAEHLGSLLVGLALLAAVILAVRYLVRSRKRGGSACSCGCEHCAASGLCHKRSGASNHTPGFPG